MKHSTEGTKEVVNGFIAVHGKGEGAVVGTRVPLSFWGGLDPSNGRIIDNYHPLHGTNISGKIFILPEGRGSCTGSGVLLEAIISGNAPSGIILREKDEIIILGGIVSNEVFLNPIPIIVLNELEFDKALHASNVEIQEDGNVLLTY